MPMVFYTVNWYLCVYDLFHILLSLWHACGSTECMYVCMYICMVCVCVCVCVCMYVCTYACMCHYWWHYIMLIMYTDVIGLITLCSLCKLSLLVTLHYIIPIMQTSIICHSFQH